MNPFAHMKSRHWIGWAFTAGLVVLLANSTSLIGFGFASNAELPQSTQPLRARAQKVYVPAYSHVYHQSGKPYLLTVTLSVRNADTASPISLTSVTYFDTHGKRVKAYLDRPTTISPLASSEFIVERNDSKGGSGASFVVDWSSTTDVNQPVIETVMIDTSGNQGISFARSGTIIK